MDHIQKKQAEIRENIRKSFIDGGAGTPNGVEYSESKEKDLEKGGVGSGKYLHQKRSKYTDWDHEKHETQAALHHGNLVRHKEKKESKQALWEENEMNFHNDEAKRKKDLKKSGMKKTMEEFKNGDLKSGSGATVTNRKQAIAIGLSEEKKEKSEEEGDVDKTATDPNMKRATEKSEDAGQEEPYSYNWDERQDKTKLKDVDLTKGQEHLDRLTTGDFQKSQSSRILAMYGIVNNVIEKSKGEGSRGGKVIGHTSSGKAIYGNHGHENHKHFDERDHQEASDKHHELADKMKESSHPSASIVEKYHRAEAQKHADSAEQRFHASEKKAADRRVRKEKMHSRLDEKFKDSASSWKEAPGEAHSMHAHLADTYNEEGKVKNGEGHQEYTNHKGHSATPGEHNTRHKRGIKELYDKVSDEGKKRFHEHYGHIVGGNE